MTEKSVVVSLVRLKYDWDRDVRRNLTQLTKAVVASQTTTTSTNTAAATTTTTKAVVASENLPTEHSPLFI